MPLMCGFMPAANNNTSQTRLNYQYSTVLILTRTGHMVKASGQLCRQQYYLTIKGMTARGCTDIDRCCSFAAQGFLEELENLLDFDSELLNRKDDRVTATGFAFHNYAGPRVNQGMTALMYASMYGQHETLRSLIHHGADLDQTDCAGRTALSIACYQGWYDGVVSLIGEGASQVITDRHGRMPLHACTHDQQIRTMAFLLHKASNLNLDNEDEEGMTALHWAAFHGRQEHVQLLLSKGASYMATDIDDKTALHWAAQHGHTGCVQTLMLEAKGTNLVNQRDQTGKGALHYAAAAGHADTISTLMKSRTTDIHLDDPQDRQPLHWAAALGRAEAVSTLLQLGANPTILDINCKSAIAYAKITGHHGCLKLLESQVKKNKGDTVTVQGQTLPDNEPSLHNITSHNIVIVSPVSNGEENLSMPINESVCMSESLGNNTKRKDTVVIQPNVTEVEKGNSVISKVSIVQAETGNTDRHSSSIQHAEGEPNLRSAGCVKNGRGKAIKDEERKTTVTSCMQKPSIQNEYEDAIVVKQWELNELPPLRGSRRQKPPAESLNSEGDADTTDTDLTSLNDHVQVVNETNSSSMAKLPRAMTFKPATVLYPA